MGDSPTFHRSSQANLMTTGKAAVKTSNLHLVEKLLDLGADVNAPGEYG
jgi:hypothetical protein